MKWQQGRRSENVDDRRGRSRVGTGATLGGGALLLIVAVALLTGRDPAEIVQVVTEGQGAGGPSTPEGPRPPAEEEQADFSKAVLADTEDTWTGILGNLGETYQPPILVLYTGSTPSSCGTGSAAMGPFYCPADTRLYLDLSFFEELDQRFGAPGDFARAYVIGHEVGHHVQALIGVAQEVDARRRRMGQGEANELSIRQELQADCFAGVWAHHAGKRGMLEPGDVEEGLAAAAAVGDDRLQRGAGGGVHPESWTHGSAEMRARWFRAGLDAGDPATCDTFSSSRL